MDKLQKTKLYIHCCVPAILMSLDTWDVHSDYFVEEVSAFILKMGENVVMMKTTDFDVIILLDFELPEDRH